MVTTTEISENKKREFAERLKRLRMERGLTQRAFTKLSNLNYTQYNRYEKAERVPSAEILSKLSEILDVSVDYLLDGTTKDAAVADFKDRDFLKIFEEAEKLDDDDKATIKKVVSALITDARLKKQYNGIKTPIAS